MVRILITYILPLALPTVLYFAWAAWVRKQIKASHAEAQNNDGDDETATAEEIAAYDIKAPWFRLILSGIVLMILSLLLSVLLGPKNPPESDYQPPRLEDGKVVPGEYAPKPN